MKVRKMNFTHTCFLSYPSAMDNEIKGSSSDLALNL